jgi:hypothetical protein
MRAWLMLSSLVMFVVMAVGCHKSDGNCTPEGNTCADSNECCGDDLCIGFMCQPPDACMDAGDVCGDDIDCCNYLAGSGYCVDGVCADSCVTGANCVSGCCAPTTMGNLVCSDASYCAQWLPLLTTCSNTSQCCAPLACAPTPDVFLCCVQSGGSCALHDDCCGEMLCYGGVCG